MRVFVFHGQLYTQSPRAAGRNRGVGSWKSGAGRNGRVRVGDVQWRLVEGGTKINQNYVVYDEKISKLRSVYRSSTTNTQSLHANVQTFDKRTKSHG